MSGQVPEAGSRVPPHSLEAEEAMLGCVLLEPEKVLPVLRGGFRVEQEWFYVPQHRVIWEGLCQMQDAGHAIDLVTFPQFLKDRMVLDQAGGARVIENLVGDALTTAHTTHYAQIVREKWLAREAVDAGRSLVEQAYFGDKPALSMLGDCALRVAEIAGRIEQPRVKHGEIVDELAGRFEYAAERRSKGEDVPLLGLDTGFHRWNDVYCGLQPGLHFIGGAPSAGKTTLAEQVAQSIALRGEPVTMFYRDDTADDYVMRSISRMAGVSLWKLQHGFASQRDLAKVREARGVIDALRMEIIEDHATVEEMCATAKFHRAKYKTKLFVADYVQIIETSVDARYMQERQVLGVVCARFKQLWKELRVPVVALSQVQREHYKDDADPRRASMADLFGGAGLEQTATSALVLKRLKDDDLPPQPLDETGYNHKYATAAHVVKNKRGPKDCLIPLWFEPSYFKFTQTPRFMKGTTRYSMTWEEQLAYEIRQELPTGCTRMLA